MSTKTMVITGGKLTDAGNFTGRTALGEVIHIYKQQLEQLGFKKAEDLKLPLYVVAPEAAQTYNYIDDQAQPTGETFNRLTALSVFKSKAELIKAHVEASTVDLEIAQGIKAAGVAAGLSEDEAVKLLKAAF